MLIPAARAFAWSNDTVVARRTLPAVVETVSVSGLPPFVQNPPSATAEQSYPAVLSRASALVGSYLYCAKEPGSAHQVPWPGIHSPQLFVWALGLFSLMTPEMTESRSTA